MFELKIKKSQLEDLVKKMALPYGQGKFVFDKIAPKFLPPKKLEGDAKKLESDVKKLESDVKKLEGDAKKLESDVKTPEDGVKKPENNGFLEWIAKNKNTTALVRAQQLDIVGITAPLRIPFETEKLLDTLSFFDNDTILRFTHDEDASEEVFESTDEKRPCRMTMPSIVLENITGMQEAFSAKIDTDGVVVFKDGSKPNMHVICDAGVFHQLITNTYKIMGSKKKDEIPNIYHVVFDGEHQFLRTIAGDDTDRAHRVFLDAVFTEKIEGNGAVHYAQGFQEVMEVLDGEINVSAVVDGPLWVVKRDNSIKAQYLISPATYKKD